MTRSQSEITRILDRLYSACSKWPHLKGSEVDDYLASSIYSFGGVRPMEKAKQTVDEWRRLRKQKP